MLELEVSFPYSPREIDPDIRRDYTTPPIRNAGIPSNTWGDSTRIFKIVKGGMAI
jgi:hypothetical protein